ncbi:hypothetical protein CEXT_632601 [Caerostris extrusa]|uniref:non-specific serine/threonine protein kinase n=1 Tax=Caerostris extrusa TaxID=172846 RepID=A0AAV4RSQ5_CAEEX|nr:hypothetical protein CEXT_632601 [Caerostris extrusa]
MTFCFFTKSLIPLRSHLISDACNKSSFQSFFENALGKTRQLLRVFYGKKSKLSSETFRQQYRLPVDFVQKSSGSFVPPKKFVFYRPGFLHNVTSKWVSDSVANSVGKEWRRKVLQRGSGPMLCFAGFVLAKKPSLLTDEEECESLSYLIRDSFSSIPWQNVGLNIDKNYAVNRQFSLSDIKIGEMIAKGCNAAVYSACFGSESGPSDTTENNTDCNFDDTSIPPQPATVLNENEQNILDTNEKESEKENLLTFRQRLIMSHSEGEQNFNCQYQKNANESNKVCHLLLSLVLVKLTSTKSGKKLKPHPNIVEMYFAFADLVPLLPGAYKYFPQALPIRLLSDGCGRNMTLFIVMKRYHCSLKDYLKMESPSQKTSLLLFTQLLEALVHLLQSGIAHRDLKTDNILLDLSEGMHSPKLAITDFGCCLEGLTLNYPNYEISKGGNMALMAPEVVNAEAGQFSQIDYSRSDLWTAGTIAYEIFGGTNPFYSPGSNLKRASYNENNLPPLPDSTDAVIQKLVKDILHKDPNQRPNQNFAATVCQILLHASSELFTSERGKKMSNKVLEWICSLSSKTYLEGALENSKSHGVEFELRHTFCSRIQYLEVIRALNYINDV